MSKKIKNKNKLKLKQYDFLKKIKEKQNFYQDKFFDPFYDSPIYFTPLDESIFSNLDNGKKFFQKKNIF